MLYITQLRVFSRADANGKAHLFRVKVLVDNGINDGRQLGIHEGVAGLLKAVNQLAQQEAQLKRQENKIRCAVI
jgi:hypothetical protein